MPSGYLHQLCAERACGMAGITPVEGDALCLGAQGPDPLFVLGMFPLRLSSRPSKVGALIHQHRTGAFLCALADRAKRGTGARGPRLRAEKACGPQRRATRPCKLPHKHLCFTIRPTRPGGGFAVLWNCDS